MRKRNIIISAVLCIFVCLSGFMRGCASKPAQEYGVFLGIGADEIERLNDYRIVVVEPAEFDAEHVKKLHEEGKTVYAYLNIGAVEEYRPYFDRFRDITLGVYEHWSDERWIDVSSSEWQSFVSDELGKTYAERGFDGFFIDNADVYYHYQTDKTFDGLCAILKRLKAYKLPLIINGGDTFVSRCIEEDTARLLFNGINQETVFTDINFEERTYGVRTKSDSLYFREYLEKAKAYGLSVYLLEYGAEKNLLKEIDDYCKKNGFIWYNAETLELR